MLAHGFARKLERRPREVDDVRAVLSLGAALDVEHAKRCLRP